MRSFCYSGEKGMEQITRLKELILPVLASSDVKLYDLKWLGNEHTLQVAVMHEDGSMDLDTCAEVSEKLSALLDENDYFESAYTLEVCSPGAEREIREISELEHMQNPYIYVRLKHPVKKMLEFTGEVQKFEEGIITLSYRDKAATRVVEFPADEIDYIRLAVRI